jgi:outer membrane protein assembly factor BamB
VVHGLRLADGHQLWSWAGGQAVYGMWPWHGTVTVLTGQVSTHARLTGLDAVTGRVVWTVRLPRQGLDGNLAASADGGLAMTGADGRAQVVDLGTGRVRWHVVTFIAQDTLPLITATDVYALEGGAAVGYPAARIADRGAANGALRWVRALGAAAFGPQPVLGIGIQAVVQTSPADGGASPGWPRAGLARCPGLVREG